MDIIITVFTVLSMYLNLSNNANSDYCYNADMEDGIVNTIYVYEKNAEYLTPTFSYHFCYDNNGRLAEKSVYKWDYASKAYEPYYKLNFEYTGDGYELSHCSWSKNNQKWNVSEEKMVYHMDNDQLRWVTHIQQNTTKDHASVNHLFVQNPYEDYLLSLIASTEK